MQRKKSGLAAWVLMCLSGAAMAQASTYVTVEQMMEIDAAAAMKRTHEMAVKSGLVQEKPAPSEVKVQPSIRRVPVWALHSLYGPSTRLQANLSVDGQRTDSVVVGDKVAACIVQSIDVGTRCVRLGRSSKKVRASDCPATVCWTGGDSDVEPSSGAAGGVKDSPLPMPLPTR